jgi:putative ABC transport system permease protein
MTMSFDPLRHALRTLGRSPWFTLVALLTLALGIGATTAMYSAVDAVLLRSLPYPQGERLVALWVDARENDMPRQEWTNPADFADWERHLDSVESMAAWSGWIPTLTGRGDATEVPGAQVSRGYFDVLGITPWLGRNFSVEDNQPNGPAVVIVSHGFWRDVLGAPVELAHAVELNGISFQVIGVLPPGFSAPQLPDRQLWRPLQADPSTGRGGHWLRVLARLKQDVGIEAAQAEFSALQGRLASEYPDSNRGLGGYVQPLHEWLGEGLRQQLLVLLGATALLLAIACANLANLLLVRASRREHEFALRASLGASRWRIARQLLVESALLGLGGALAGLLLARLGTQWVGSVLPPEITRVAPLAIDLRVAAFAVVLALGCSLLFGLAPALAAARRDLAASLRGSERGAHGRAAGHLRALLVTGTFALALALCTGAGLFMKSLGALQDSDPGFTAERALSLRLLLPRGRYPDADAVRLAHAELEQRLAALPGVESVGLTSTLPLGEGNSDAMIQLEGAAAGAELRRVWYSQVSPGYLPALQVPLRAGRGIEPADRDGARRVVLVNQAFVEAYLEGGPALGRRLRFGDGAEPDWLEIVGVAGDLRFFDLAQAQTPSLYLSAAQFPGRSFYLVLRSHGEPDALLPQVRAAVADIDPLLALTPMTMQARVDAALSTPRLLAALTSGFAALALLLAALGVYGVVAYTVATRTREFGLRLALGSTARRLLQGVLASGLRLALAGMLIGGLLSLLVARALDGLLFQVEPFDPWVVLAVAALLGAVALLACLLPALRTLRIAPSSALRHD